MMEQLTAMTVAQAEVVVIETVPVVRRPSLHSRSRSTRKRRSDVAVTYVRFCGFISGQFALNNKNINTGTLLQFTL